MGLPPCANPPPRPRLPVPACPQDGCLFLVQELCITDLSKLLDACYRPLPPPIAKALIQQTLAGKRAPGDFALTGNIQVTDSSKKAEIKHSRLAMMAFSGIATQSAITHGAIGFPYF